MLPEHLVQMPPSWDWYPSLQIAQSDYGFDPDRPASERKISRDNSSDSFSAISFIFFLISICLRVGETERTERRETRQTFRRIFADEHAWGLLRFITNTQDPSHTVGTDNYRRLLFLQTETKCSV